MGCIDGCIKYLLFGFNLLFALSGLALLIVGSVKLSEISDWSDLVDGTDAANAAPQITLIVIGIIIFFIATLGCCGAIRENRCMLITFAILLLTVFIIELAIGIYAITNFSDLKDAVTKGLDRNFDNIVGHTEIKEAFDSLQKSVHCCGVEDYRDYRNRLSQNVPDSCCKVYTDNCALSQNPATFWEKGCAQELTDFTSDAGKVIGGVAIGLSIIEVLGAIFALRLASTVK